MNYIFGVFGLIGVVVVGGLIVAQIGESWGNRRWYKNQVQELTTRVYDLEHPKKQPKSGAKG